MFRIFPYGILILLQQVMQLADIHLLWIQVI